MMRPRRGEGATPDPSIGRGIVEIYFEEGRRRREEGDIILRYGRR
jgi:hypothetical protein